MINIRNVLYAIDFSPRSNQAYFHAAALAESYGATLTIAHVYTPDPNGSKDVEGDELRRQRRNELEQIPPLNARIPVRHVPLDGEPAEATHSSRRHV
jgi:hypothetical protein